MAHLFQSHDRSPTLTKPRVNFSRLHEAKSHHGTCTGRHQLQRANSPSPQLVQVRNGQRATCYPMERSRPKLQRQRSKLHGQRTFGCPKSLEQRLRGFTPEHQSLIANTGREGQKAPKLSHRMRERISRCLQHFAFSPVCRPCTGLGRVKFKRQHVTERLRSLESTHHIVGHCGKYPRGYRQKKGSARVAGTRAYRNAAVYQQCT